MIAFRERWTLDPEVAFLNHGSFGATPRSVLEHQAELRARLEREPVAFFERFLPGALATAREAVAGFVGADPAGLAFIPNASTGVATVLANQRFEPGDELLVTDHAYAACHNAFLHSAERAGVRLVMARYPFPGTSADAIVEGISAAVSDRTRLALIDHVTSPTGLVLPLERVLGVLAARGVDVLVDGAHAPGMVPVDVAALASAGMTYYTANGHKWPCAPKGAAFLWVREDRRAGFHPMTISHGLTMPLDAGATRFRAEHDWTGTDDPTAYLCFATAIEHVGAMMPGGWPAIRQRNRELALAMRDALCAAFAIPAPCDDDLIGSLATVPLPADRGPDTTCAATLHERLHEEHRVQVPVYDWGGRRMLRVAPHLHTSMSDLERLLAALAACGEISEARGMQGAASRDE
jgi:isopenicillin-N epimerase